MTRGGVLADLRARFAGDIVAFQERSARRVYIEIRPASIRTVAGFLFRDLGARFNIASGVDGRRHVEILYHFTLEDINLLISLRVRLPKPDPEVESLTPLFEAANWVERELHELLGIGFTGHPDLRRLLLPEEWPRGVYPLRRDYQEWDPTALRDRGV